MKDNLVLSSLQERIKDDEPKLLDHMIEEFSCARDPDVEAFLKEKAVPYERSGVSRTYFYTMEEDKPCIVAFFAVAITSTGFERVTKSRKAKILGGKPGRDTKDHFGGILIAQLARCDDYSTEDINGKEMLFDAEKIIERGRYFLGGKVIYLDCRKSLIEFYEENGYSQMSDDPYSHDLYKMFKGLPKI